MRAAVSIARPAPPAASPIPTSRPSTTSSTSIPNPARRARHASTVAVHVRKLLAVTSAPAAALHPALRDLGVGDPLLDGLRQARRRRAAPLRRRRQPRRGRHRGGLRRRPAGGGERRRAVADGPPGSRSGGAQGQTQDVGRPVLLTVLTHFSLAHGRLLRELICVSHGLATIPFVGLARCSVARRTRQC